MARDLCLSMLVLCVAASPAAAETLRVGFAAPLSGPSEILGRQALAGANAAVAASGLDDLDLVVADDACSAEGGAAAARQFVAAQVIVAAGFLCTEAVTAAMPILTEAGIPAIVVGARANGLTDQHLKTGWPLFRMAPRADDEADAVGRILTAHWRTELFAIVDDGTIYGRELAEAFRIAAEERALKPVFTDTYRPQLENQVALAGRLNRSGATHVFLGGDRLDAAILGRDAAVFETGLTIAGGEVFRAPPDEIDLAPGTLMVGLPEWADIAAPAAVEAIAAKGVVVEGYAVPGYAGMEVAIAAAAAHWRSQRPAADILRAEAFETALGEIRFDDKGDWNLDPYRLFVYRDGVFVEADAE